MNKIMILGFRMDDIQDNATVRRGAAPAHIVFGIPATVSCIGFLFLDIQEKIFKLNHPKAIKVYTEFMTNLYRAQRADMYWSESSICPTIPQWLETSNRKNVVCYFFTARFMQLFSKRNEDFSYLLEMMGEIFLFLNL